MKNCNGDTYDLWWVSNETLSNVYSLLINGKSTILSFYTRKHKHVFPIIFYDNTYKNYVKRKRRDGPRHDKVSLNVKHPWQF